LTTYCYQYMFQNCSALIMRTDSGDDASEAFSIPSSGVATGTPGSAALANMFAGCTGGTGTKAPDTPSLTNGNQLTYYTQNAPVTATVPE